jgi:hypothetical protein
MAAPHTRRYLGAKLKLIRENRPPSWQTVTILENIPRSAGGGICEVSVMKSSSNLHNFNIKTNEGSIYASKLIGSS